MKKILFACMPFDGHFNPLTGIAMRLKSQGHDVRWYTGSFYKVKADKLGIPFYPFVKAVNFNQHNVNEVFPERLKIKSQVNRLKFDLRQYFILRAPEFYQDINEINKTWDFDVMISDIGFTAIPLVKEKLNKHVISVGVFPLTENSVDLPPAGLGMQPSNSFLGKIKQDILRFVADNVIFRESSKIQNNQFKELGMKPERGNLFEVCGKKSELLLQSGTPGFEYMRSDLSENIRFVGALLPYSDRKKHVIDFGQKLESYSKVILVTQGTLEKDPEKIIVPTLEAFKSSQYLVVATTGGSGTEELQKRYPQTNIVIRDFISFDEIMPHCDIYVTNGGYGGVMLGIENQLPLVVAGEHEGKNEINARVGYFKLGIDLKTEFPKPEQIRKSVENVLSDNIYKSNVVKLGTEFKKYDPLALCEKYVDEILKDQSKKYSAYPEYI